MNKFEFIVKQIAKTNKKNYENYAVTRIWHVLNDLDVKFYTQQYISKKNGYYLADLCFPDLKLYIEVDEPHHERTKLKDLNRKNDIINSIGFEHKTIEIKEEIQEVNKQIDNVVDYIKIIIKQQKHEGTYIPWRFGEEFTTKFHIEKGYLSVQENDAFNRVMDACNCFGHNYKRFQGGWTINKHNPKQHLWFPKLYKIANWDNSITLDGSTIFERCTSSKEAREKHYKKVMNENIQRITFPHSKDNLGFVLYRFKGVYVTDKEASDPDTGIIHRRIANRIKLQNG